MQIKSLRLRAYRNYESLSLEPSSGLNVFVGDNAAGKTNMLEALFLLALGRSHRTRKDIELIKNGSEYANAQVELEKRTGKHSLSIRLSRQDQRRLLIDGKPLTRSGELLGCLHVVMFSPEDLRLIKQGPSERRRFMDMELSQLQPSYYYLLQQYNAALRQRNALLKAGAAPERLYTPWDEQLSALGAAIQLKRHSFLKRLSNTAAALHHELSNGKERLRVIYRPSLEINGEDDGKAAFMAALSALRARDMARGSTSVGPHRDDIELLLDDVDVRAYGSQGQQRTTALSVKLSELMLIKELEREPPVLLLDDVLSELDKTRQRQLVTAMQGIQTFLTCTQLQGLRDAGAGAMQLFHVKSGKLGAS